MFQKLRVSNNDGIIAGRLLWKRGKWSIYLKDPPDAGIHRDLKPLRIPLHSKRSKRCPACTHILIKPEQKAQSVRYKIKLVAANYLPAITVALPHQIEMLGHISAEAAKRSTKAPVDDDKDTRGGLQAGKTYPFHMSLTNPLYDPIQVRLSVQRMHVAAAVNSGEGGTIDKARRPPFAISIPTTPFSVAPFVEAWEYEDDEEMFGLDDDELEARLSGREKEPKPKSKTVGILEKRANVTVVGGEVALGKEARGEVKVSLLDFHGLIPSSLSSSIAVQHAGCVYVSL